MTKAETRKGNIALLLCALIWGSSFVAQSVGMDYIGPFTFQCVRSILAVLILGGFLLIRRTVTKKSLKVDRQALLGGLTCGILLSCASWFQNAGLRTTSAGKAAFITALYIILVPFFSIALKKRVPLRIFFCAFAALVGLYFLSFSGNELSEVDPGDLQCLVCSAFFAVHIMAVDHFVKKMDSILLSFLQFAVSAVLSVLPMTVFEDPTLAGLSDAAPSLLYSGIMSCGVAYTLQLVGQRYAEPAVATILMSLESVFSVITGIIILRQFPTGREWVGCVIMFVAVILSQLPEKGRDAYKWTDGLTLFAMRLFSGGLSKKKAASQYEANVSTWEQVRKNAVDAEGFIEQQGKLAGVSYGTSGVLADGVFFGGKKMDATDNTCEVIAHFNAVRALSGEADFPALLKTYAEDGISFGGRFGTNPRKIEEHLKKEGYGTGSLSGRKLFGEELHTFADSFDTFVLSSYNRGHKLTSMIHTVCISKTDGGYRVRNAQDTSVYKTAEEAIRAFAGAPLYLIGVRKEQA